MAEVWAAKHELMDQEAAVKMLLPAMSSKEDIVKRFFNEAQAAARIKHPGIVDVFDVGYAPDGRAYIVMERLQGENLHVRVERTRILSLDQTVTWMRQLAGVMASAHERGIIHRDLKPENLFIVPDPDVAGGERIKVLDFGLAKLAVGAGSVLTAQGAIFGTPAYMAPEQCEDAGSVDPRVDLYAIGCILYRCLCGRPPFGTGGLAVLEGHMHRTPVRPGELCDDLPQEVDDLIMKLLAKSPDDRVQSCAELVEILERMSGTSNAGILVASLDDVETEAYRTGSVTAEADGSTFPDGVEKATEVIVAEPDDSTFPGADKTDHPGAQESTLPSVDGSGETAVTVPDLVFPGAKTPKLDSMAMKTLVSEKPSGPSPAVLRQPAPGQMPGQMPGQTPGRAVRHSPQVRPGTHGHGVGPQPRRHREMLWAFAGSLVAGIVIAAFAIGFGGGDSESAEDPSDDAGQEIAPMAAAPVEPGPEEASPGSDALEATSPGPSQESSKDAGVSQDGAAQAGDSPGGESLAGESSEAEQGAESVAESASDEDADAPAGPSARPRSASAPAARSAVSPHVIEQQAADIRAAFRFGDHARASQLCRRAQSNLRKDRDTLALCAMAGCRQGKADIARRYLRRLPASHRASIQQYCLKSGVDLAGSK